MQRRSGDRKQPTSVNLGSVDRALLGAVAVAEDRSKSNVVRRAIKSYAEKEGIVMPEKNQEPVDETQSEVAPGEVAPTEIGKALDASETGDVTGASPTGVGTGNVVTRVPPPGSGSPQVHGNPGPATAATEVGDPPTGAPAKARKGKK